jgi:hypothetical protein
MPTLSKNSAVSWRRIYLLPIGTTGGFCDDGGNMTRRQKRHQPPRIAPGLVLPNRPNPKTRPSRGDRKEPQVFPLRCAAGCFCLLFPFAVGPVEAWTDVARAVPPTLWETPTNYSLLCGCRFRGDGDGRTSSIAERTVLLS